MRLDQLISVDAVDAGQSIAPVEIGSLAYDSRRVRRGALFFCVSGFAHDGHDFAGAAIGAGAAALVVERPLSLGVPEVLVESARAAMAPVAARFYGDPTSELRVLGVTGTNGKTTTAFLLRALCEAGGERCGLLSTVKSLIGGAEGPMGRTTPEAIDLQADFRAMLDSGERFCAMEVSSHALALDRTAGVRFEAAIFTNLTQDHLDFHASMEQYFAAKRSLFVPAADAYGPPPRWRVINVADPYGRRLAAELDGAVTFAVHDLEERDPILTGASYRATDVRCERRGCRFMLHTPTGSREVVLPMPGGFNVANALGAFAALHTLGLDLDLLVGALETGVRVPGRFEAVDEGQEFAVLVDYAHTPDSLENVLGAARELAGMGEGESGRVLCVFGAGGDRDRGKRALMGEIAARLADVVIVTSDNPRSEDPEAIIDEIVAGAARARAPKRGLPVQIEPDRRAAIAQAVSIAGGGDVLVIAGKGHEQGQELAAGRKVPFDDVSVAREALHARGVPAGTR